MTSANACSTSDDSDRSALNPSSLDLKRASFSFVISLSCAALQQVRTEAARWREALPRVRGALHRAAMIVLATSIADYIEIDMRNSPDAPRRDSRLDEPSCPPGGTSSEWLSARTWCSGPLSAWTTNDNACSRGLRLCFTPCYWSTANLTFEFIAEASSERQSSTPSQREVIVSSRVSQPFGQRT